MALKVIFLIQIFFSLWGIGTSIPMHFFVQKRSINDVSSRSSGGYYIVQQNSVYGGSIQDVKTASLWQINTADDSFSKVGLTMKDSLFKSSSYESIQDYSGNIYIVGKAEKKFLLAKFDVISPNNYQYIEELTEFNPPSSTTTLATINFNVEHEKRFCAYIHDYNSDADVYECRGNHNFSLSGKGFSSKINDQFLYQSETGVQVCKDDAQSPLSCEVFDENKSLVCSTLQTPIKNFFVCAADKSISIYDKGEVLTTVDLQFEDTSVVSDKVHLLGDYIFVFSNPTNEDEVYVNVFERKDTELVLKQSTSINNVKRVLGLNNVNGEIFGTVVDGDEGLSQLLVTNSNPETDEGISPAVFIGIPIVIGVLTMLAIMYKRQQKDKPTTRSRSSTTVENLVIGAKMEQKVVNDSDSNTYVRRLDENVTVSQTVGSSVRKIVFEQAEHPELIAEIDRVLAEEDTTNLDVFFNNQSETGKKEDDGIPVATIA